MNGLDLFSGIGGISIALQDYVIPITYCEIEPFCQAVLLSRMATGDLVHAPIWDNVQTLRFRKVEVDIDIIYGGFPCQDISIAGHGKGLEGERSGLFFEILRLAKEIKPQFLFLENVPAITSRGGLRVVREIAALGYDCRWCVISAASVGALHRRERWFLLANANSSGRNSEQRGKSFRLQEAQPEFANDYIKDGCNADSESGEQTNQDTESNETIGKSWRRPTRQCWPFESRAHWQETVSTMGKCSDGISNHVDRLRALGNSVVRCQVKEAFEILMGIK